MLIEVFHIFFKKKGACRKNKLIVFIACYLVFFDFVARFSKYSIKLKLYTYVSKIKFLLNLFFISIYTYNFNIF